MVGYMKAGLGMALAAAAMGISADGFEPIDNHRKRMAEPEPYEIAKRSEAKNRKARRKAQKKARKITRQKCK